MRLKESRRTTSSAEPHLAHIKARALAHLGDLGGAVRIYKEALSQRGAGTLIAEAVARYQSMADTLVQKGEYAQALTCLRSALNLVEQDTGTMTGDMTELYGTEQITQASSFPSTASGTGSIWSNLASFFSRSYDDSSVSRWVGGVLGLAVWSYLWFWTPDIGLDPGATKLLGLLSLTLIYWVFWVFPDYGVALIFALGLILTRLGRPEVVLGGFASTTWFMTLGVLALGAAITGSGTLLPPVTSVGSLFSVELLLADCRFRFHGNRRDGPYPTTKCSHCDHQPNACQSL